MKSHNKVGQRRAQLAVMTSASLLGLLAAAALTLGAPATDSSPSQQQQPPSSAVSMSSGVAAAAAGQPQAQASQEHQQQAALGSPASDSQLQQQTQIASSNSIGQMVPSPPPPPPPPMTPSSLQQQQQQQHQYNTMVIQQAQQPIRLPKINIFLSKHEVYKLLGLADTTIHYVSGGQVNSYPLGFTVPMGYDKSDMIFTWQNLGQTNVNYSISLVISNIEAVERPIINITRSGLIPRHEQVFKITLPCSGKVTDDADIQVLINISGLVPVGGEHELAGDDLGAALDAGGGGEPGFHKLARAVQQQNELLAASAAAQQQAGEQMQADQQQVGGGADAKKQLQMRLVSHTLAIKRRKICTVAPVPVQPVPWPAVPARHSPNELVRPPNQPPATLLANAPSHPQQQQQQQQDKVISATAQVATNKQPLERQQPTSASGHQSTTPEPVAEPAHQPTWQTPLSTPAVQTSDSPPASSSSSTSTSGAPQLVPQAPLPPVYSAAAVARRLSAKPANEASSWLRSPSGGPVQSPNFDPLPRGIGADQAPPAPGGSSPLLLPLIVMSLVISLALIALLVLGSSSAAGPSYGRQTPLDKLRALTNCIWRRTSAGSRAVNKCTKHVGPITIKNGIIGTFGQHQHHQDGASSLATANTLGRTTGGRPGGMLHHHAPTKSAVDSLSGLSTISGQQSGAGGKLHAQNANFNSLMGPYYYKQQQQELGSNYAGYFGGGGGSHHYQQALDNMLIGPTSTTSSAMGNTSIFHGQPSTSPYHITMSNNQTTKLYLGGGGGGGSASTNTNNHSSLEQANYTIDNSYMPITATTTRGGGYPQPYSDTGSVYQTIN